MMTRKEKREKEKEANYFFELLKTKSHFFKDFNKMLENVQDPRHQSYTTYDPEVMLMMVILKNACNLKSMRTMTNQFNKDTCIQNMGKYLGQEHLDELPHYDTINDFLSRMKPEELEGIRTYMIRELLHKRCFDDYRINGKYWGVIVDGTGIFTFDEKHCDHCLKREFKRINPKNASSQQYNAMKNHYLLTQITDILMVLHEHGSKVMKRIKKTAKEISSDLLEAFRGHLLTNEDITQLGKPIQIRFT